MMAQTQRRQRKRPAVKAAPPRRPSARTSTKLAEALIVRADLQKRIAQLKARLIQNAKVQEGEKPAEEPARLIAELGRATRELLDLIQRINRTNVATEISRGVSLSDAIAQRDILKLQHSIYRELGQAAVIEQSRYSKSEVKFKATVDVAAIQKEADDFARQHRELDAKIQAANWQAELRK
ncbi:MAG: DIP1984 family protein [Dehalococcoidia bacterium]